MSAGHHDWRQLMVAAVIARQRRIDRTWLFVGWYAGIHVALSDCEANRVNHTRDSDFSVKVGFVKLYALR